MKMPKIRFADLDKKLLFLLAALCVVNVFSDFIPAVGPLANIPELLVDVTVAYLLGKRTLKNAEDRERGNVVKGQVVDYDPTAKTEPGGG